MLQGLRQCSPKLHRPQQFPDGKCTVYRVVRSGSDDYKGWAYGLKKAGYATSSTYAEKLIDTSVKGIIAKLDLRKPQYQATSAYGHFGNPSFAWERIVKL